MDKNELRHGHARQAFDRSHRPEDAYGLETKEQWERYNEITERSRKAKAEATRQLTERFASRVAREMKKLMVMPRNTPYEPKPVSGSGGFNPTRLRADAERIVHLRHAQRLIRVDIAEATMKLKLSKAAIDQTLERAREQFRGQWLKTSRGRSR